MSSDKITKNHPLHDKFPSVANLSNPTQLEFFINEFPELAQAPSNEQRSVYYVGNVIANALIARIEEYSA